MFRVSLLAALSFCFSVAQAQSVQTIRVQTPMGMKPLNVSFPSRNGAGEIVRAYAAPPPFLHDLHAEESLLSENQMDSILAHDSGRLIVRAIRMLSELIHFHGNDLDMAKLAQVRYSVEPYLPYRVGGLSFYPEKGPKTEDDVFESAVARNFSLPYISSELSSNPRFTPERYARVSASRVRIVFSTLKGEVTATFIICLEDSYLPFVTDKQPETEEAFGSRMYGVAQLVHVRGFTEINITDSIQDYLPDGLRNEFQATYRFAVSTKSVSSDLPQLFKNVLNVPVPRRLGYELPIKAKDPLYNFVRFQKSFFEVPDGRGWYEVWK